MKKFAFVVGMLLTLATLTGVAPAGAVPVSTGRTKAAETRLALFQQRTIFHSGITRAHTIALTFDDGPNAHTEEVLDALKKLHVKATFFIVGQMGHTHPATLARIAAEGHLLANHSAEHFFIGASYDAAPAKLLHQLRDVDEQIEPLMKPGDKLFYRAPYGAWKSAHAEILNNDPRLRNYIGPIYWDVGGDISVSPDRISVSPDRYVMSAADWDCWHLKWSARTCAKGYMREIRRKDGGVVLMHCIHVNSADLVEAVVPALIEEGYKFVRLDQMPEYKQYETPGSDRAIAQATPLAKVGMIRISDIK